jgi:hypothetical protein
MTEIHWQKSSFSDGAGVNCVQLAAFAERVHIRESDAPGVVLTTTPARLAVFLRRVKVGDFDQPR